MRGRNADLRNFFEKTDEKRRIGEKGRKSGAEREKGDLWIRRKNAKT